MLTFTLPQVPPNPSTSSLASKTTDKLVAEFRYLQSQATGTLVKFMSYLTYGYSECHGTRHIQANDGFSDRQCKIF